MKVPPCVSFAFLQSVCHGWMTDQRFRTRPVRPCVFCCSDLGSDDFHHYCKCNTLWSAFGRLGLGDAPASEHRLRMLLLLDGNNHIELRMAFLYACMVSVHKLRSPHVCVAEADRENYIRANFKNVCSRGKNLKRLSQVLWVSHGRNNGL